MRVKICEKEFDPWQEVQDYLNTVADWAGEVGANCLFMGTMRDFNDGDPVFAMTLEHYPGMTEKELAKIVVEAMENWHIKDILVVHRVGTIYPNEPIVLVSVWAAHRGHSFDACRYVLEALKSRAPFWKKEVLDSNRSRWLNRNTDGYNADTNK